MARRGYEYLPFSPRLGPNFPAWQERGIELRITRVSVARLRSIALLSVAAVVASLAFVAGPLAMPSRAADVHDLDDFYEQVDLASNETVAAQYVISLQSDLEFTSGDEPAFLTASVDVVIDGNGHDVTCLAEDPAFCEGWLRIESVEEQAVIEIIGVDVSGFRQAVWARNSTLSIADSYFRDNGAHYEDDDDHRGAALQIFNYEAWDAYATLDNVHFIGNEISSSEGCLLGGAALIEGDFTMNGGSFRDNVIRGTESENGLCWAAGAALYIYGANLGIFGTEFSNNRADAPFDDSDPHQSVKAGAVEIYNSYGPLEDVTFTDNASDGEGGAIRIGESTVWFNDAAFSNNSAVFGGAIFAYESWLGFDDGNFDANHAGIAGGAVYAASADVEIENTEFTDNTSVSSGGGVFALRTPVYIEDSVFTGNATEGSYGGALELDNSDNEGESYIDDSTITRSLFANNSANAGGAIDVYLTYVHIEATTITGNRARQGAALNADDAGAYLEHVTVAGNTTTDDDYGQLAADNDGWIGMYGSAVVDPAGVGGNCAWLDGGEFESYGFNAVDDNTCDSEITDLELDPGEADLGELRFNGGPTWTMLPSPESPLVDAIPIDECVWEGENEGDLEYSFDQRGVQRPQWDACDIGAAEIFEPIVGDFTTSGGTVTVRLLNASGAEGAHSPLSLFTPPPPAGIAFPYGGFELGIEVWDEGWPVDVEYTTPAPTNQLWKLFDAEWVNPPDATSSTAGGKTTWKFRLIDGGFGDNDLVANAFIEDPIAAGVGAAFTG